VPSTGTSSYSHRAVRLHLAIGLGHCAYLTPSCSRSAARLPRGIGVAIGLPDLTSAIGSCHWLTSSYSHSAVRLHLAIGLGHCAYLLAYSVCQYLTSSYSHSAVRLHLAIGRWAIVLTSLDL